MALGPQLTALLKRYGLESLTTWASNAVIQDLSPEEIELQLFDLPEFKARFPAIDRRTQLGLPPLSVDEYLEYEQAAGAMAKNFGVDIKKAEIDELLAGQVSVQELQERFTLAARSVYQTDPTTRAELQSRYGIGPGDLVRYWFDGKKMLPDLQRKWVQADIAGAATRAGYDPALSEANLATLYGRGVTGETAQEGFGVLNRARELFEQVDMTERDLTVDEQIDLMTGNEDLSQEVERRGEKRAAKFSEGGGFSTGRTGVGGLGSANT